MKSIIVFIAMIGMPSFGLAQETQIAGNACLDGAQRLLPRIDGTKFDLGEGLICDADDTGFFQIRIRRHLRARVTGGGLPQLFYQRAHLYVDAAREGREVRLSYEIVPYDAPNLWKITVTDSAGNMRENLDYIWARNFRDLGGNAPTSLLLGEPIVYFACTGRQGLTCFTAYNVDKCYAVPSDPEGTKSQSHRYYDVSVAAIGPENVEKLFRDYEQINKIAEDVLRTISPAACQSSN